MNLMKNIIFIPKIAAALVLIITLAACTNSVKDDKNTNGTENRVQINKLIDSFHTAASKADFDNYFKCLADSAVFIGTDATEYWDKKSFMVWAKPHFDKGKAWTFHSLERHIYMDKSGNMAWFDELLNTSMKICRGSGVLIKDGNQWKIEQYVLSMTIPNAKTDSIVKIKSAAEDLLIQKLLQK